MTCADGIKRRIYPRIFSYSADYPEKYVYIFTRIKAKLIKSHRVLLATIRDMGDRPCPRCLVPKDKLDLMGTLVDKGYRIGQGVRVYFKNIVEKARQLIYRKAKGITSVAVENLLKETSSVPTIVRCILLNHNPVHHLTLLKPRMPSLIVLVLNSHFNVCLWSISCMSSSLECGNRSSYN